MISKSRADVEANRFAIAFLMPEKLFRKVVIENTIDGICNLEVVAKRFKVEIEHVYIRGKMLGMWV